MGSSSSRIINDSSPFGGHADEDEILRSVMRQRGSPYSIPFKYAKVNLRGHGKATCSHCGREWTSYQASATVNFREQRVVRVWKQKCQKCKTAVAMTFKKTKFEEMVNKQLDRLERKMRGEWIHPAHDQEFTPGPPHRSELCEGCGYGTGDCRQRADSSGGSGYDKEETDDRATTGTSFTGVGPDAGTLAVRNYYDDDDDDDDDDQGTGSVGMGYAVGAGLLAAGAAVLFGMALTDNNKKKRP